MEPLLLLGLAAGAGGTALSASGTIAGGNQSQQAANYQAGQLENQANLTRQRADLMRVQAGEARAAGKQELAEAGVERDEFRRKKELTASAAQARAAAGGFSATDPTSLAIADEIERYGTLQERRAIAGGTYRRAARFAQGRSIDTEANVADLDADNIDTQAKFARWQGEVSKKASRVNAMSTILGGVSNLALRFNPTSKPSGDGYRYGGGYDPKWGNTTVTRY